MVLSRIKEQERFIFGGFNEIIFRAKNNLLRLFNDISGRLANFLTKHKGLEFALKNYLLRIEQSILSNKTSLENYQQKIQNGFSAKLKEIIQRLYFIAQAVRARDPRNNLALGYCLARKNGKLVKTVDSLRPGDDFSLQIADGIVDSTVKKLTTRADL